VGLHLRDLRPNIDGPGSVGALIAGVDELRRGGIEARGRIVLFSHVRDPEAAARILEQASRSRSVVVTRTARLSDAELIADLASLDASLLPYRHGTHSGWAELCWDLALPAVGAHVGYIADQHSDAGWFTAVSLDDTVGLARALAVSQEPRETRAKTVISRQARRDREAPLLAAAHRAVYRRALEGLTRR
jgi:hypothetical protein